MKLLVNCVSIAYCLIQVQASEVPLQETAGPPSGTCSAEVV